MLVSPTLVAWNPPPRRWVVIILLGLGDLKFSPTSRGEGLAKWGV